MKEKFLSKGNVALFAIALVITVLAGIITAAFTEEKVNIVAISAMGGVLSMLIIGGLCEIANYKLPVGPDAGILGVVVGTLLTLLIY